MGRNLHQQTKKDKRILRYRDDLGGAVDPRTRGLSPLDHLSQLQARLRFSKLEFEDDCWNDRDGSKGGGGAALISGATYTLQ